MSDLREAFTKAGLPVHAVAFAAACHDLAVLVLNREPRRAAAAWLGMAGGLGFRRALEEYLAEVAKEVKKSVGGVSHSERVARKDAAQLPTEPDADAVARTKVSQDQVSAASSIGAPNSAGGEGQNAAAAQSLDAAPPVEPERERGGQGVRANHGADAASLAPRGPSPEQVRAVTAAKAASARVMSGIYITERQGSRTLLDDITVASLDRRLQWQGGRVAKDALEYNTLWLVKEQIKRQAFVPEGAAVGDVIEAEGLRQLHGLARAFARSPMVQLPEQLRSDAEAA